MGYLFSDKPICYDIQSIGFIGKTLQEKNRSLPRCRQVQRAFLADVPIDSGINKRHWDFKCTVIYKPHLAQKKNAEWEKEQNSSMNGGELSMQVNDLPLENGHIPWPGSMKNRQFYGSSMDYTIRRYSE
jgi:hypothetical protein